MAITILPKENSNQQLWAGLGGGLQAISKGLDQRRQGDLLEEAGIPRGLSSMDPRLAAAILKNKSQTGADRLNDQRAKLPFFKQLNTSADSAKKLLPNINAALDLVDKTSLTGPVWGRIPAGFSEEASELDSVLNQILLDKASLEAIGGARGTKFYLELQKAAKANRAMPAATLKKRLNDLKEEAQKSVAKERSYSNLVESGHANQLSNSQMESLINNAQRMYERTPPVDQYQEGDEIEDGGYRFKKEDGDWVFVGKD